MSRINTAAELFKEVSAIGFITDVVTTPGSTTTDAIHSAGDTAISVVSETNFVADDLVRIGSGESFDLGVVASAAAGEITLKTGLAYDQISGVSVIEQYKIDMGHIAEGGVTQNVSEDVFEVRAATTKQVLSRRTTGVSEEMSWPGILWSLENIAVAFGMDELTAILGAGSAANPYAIRLVADLFNTLLNTSLYMTGSLEDATNFEIRGWNCRYDLNKSSTFARNAVAELPTGGEVKTIEYLLWT